MTLREARELQAEIRDKWGYHCTVPLGWGPNGYWCQISTSVGSGRFMNRAEARKYRADSLRRHRNAMRELSKPLVRPARSPIERMVDRACGL